MSASVKLTFSLSDMPARTFNDTNPGGRKYSGARVLSSTIVTPLIVAPMGNTRSRICATVSLVRPNTSSDVPRRPSVPGSIHGLISVPAKKSMMSLRRRDAPMRSSVKLGEYTHQAFTNNGWHTLRRDRTYEKGEDGRSWRTASARRTKPVPLPDRLGEPSVFKHVFYIIKENRTYDQVLGALPQGNGDPSLVQFGREVTPNQHALVEQFVLFDNLSDSGSNSADGHQWVTQAFVPDYLEKSFGGFARTYPFHLQTPGLRT